MGDRGNIVMRFYSGPKTRDIYFYTHNEGSCIGMQVHATLSRRARWDDPEYLARMIFTDLIDGDREETGFGIGPDVCGNEHDFLIVDTARRMVHRAEPAADRTLGGITHSWTFEEFIAEDPNVLDNW